MNGIHILKQSDFYTKLIEDQKKQMWHCNTYNKYVGNPQTTYNKYKYVKKDSTVITPVQKDLTNKVLINPNFKQKVLINPHFNGQNRKIHVNPKVLNTQLPSNSNKPVNVEPTIPLPLPSVNQTLLRDVPNLTSVRTPPRKRRFSIRSKYKIVKSSCLNTPAKSDVQKYPTIQNKYKIDRRSVNNTNKSIIKKKVIRHGISDMLRHNVFKNKIWKKSLIINQFKSHNTRLTNISGILYKKTQTKLQKVQSSNNTKYRISSNKTSLRRISYLNKINKTGRKTTRTSLKFIKSKNLSTNNTRKLKYTRKIQVNKLQKNNLPCPVYRRYGNCRRKDSGRCHFLHNPNQIFLCKKFLQGACIDKDCLLSHKVSLEKMPTCKYFLDGCCVRNDCQYLHVKINPRADICRKFLEGFCEKGSQCNLRHQFLCPNYEKTGTCPKRKCMYPHKNKTEPVKQKSKPREEKKEELVECVRYYIDNAEPSTAENAQVINKNAELPEDESKKPKRPQLGVLPSYIPFN